jgi:hypothetical protein
MYVYVAVFLFALSTGFAGGWKVQAWRYGAQEAERLAVEHAVEEQRRDVADTASAGLETDRTAIRTEFKTIYSEVERVVEKPVYRDVCIDADGLRILSGAITGHRPAASEPAGPVPRSFGPR